jgi:hypothetical protein
MAVVVVASAASPLTMSIRGVHDVRQRAAGHRSRGRVAHQQARPVTLGNCGGGTSREHIISASQWDADSITLSGLPWCKEPKTVGLASLVARNLCREHNTALSPVDNEMRQLKVALKTILESPKLPVRVELDARLIERWLLKTTINLALQGAELGARGHARAGGNRVRSRDAANGPRLLLRCRDRRGHDRYFQLAPQRWLAIRARLDPDELARPLSQVAIPPPLVSDPADA